MNDLRVRWLKALRSGKYKQGRKFLREPNDLFCCLGVLCDVYDNSKWTIDSHSTLLYNGAMSMPPSEISSAVNMSVDDLNQCVVWNDSKNLSFEQIADLLEAGFNEDAA